MLAYEPFVNITGTAQMYSQIAGVLAGFAFTALLGFLRHGANAGDGQGEAAADYTFRSVALVLFSAMTALIICAVLYGILAGGQDASGTAFSAVVIDGPSFSLAILGMFYAIGLAATPYPHMDAMLAAVRLLVGVFGPAIALVLVDTAVLDLYLFKCGFYTSSSTCDEMAQLSPGRPFGFGLILTLVGTLISGWFWWRLRRPPATIPSWIPTVTSSIVFSAAVMSVAGVVLMTPMSEDYVPPDELLYVLLVVLSLMMLTISILTMWSCHPMTTPPPDDSSEAGALPLIGKSESADDGDAARVEGPQVTRAELSGRYRTYLATHYLGLHVTVVSVALGVAGLAAASLMATSEDLGHAALLYWLLWLSSLLAVAVAYAGTMTGAIGLPARVPTLLDLAIPLLMAVVEVLLFGVLVSQIVGLDSQRAVIAAWFFLIATFGLIAVAAILRARQFFQPIAYAADLIDTVLAYRQRLIFDVLGAVALTVLGLVGGLLQVLRTDDSIMVALLLAGAVTVCLVGALVGHNQTARLWQDAMRVQNPRPDHATGLRHH